MFSTKFRLGIGLIVVAGMIGCSGSGGDRPKTEKVSGTVTYKGKPVDGAVVKFISDDAAKPAAVGRTDASGKFTLMTFDSGDGAVVGTFKVAITKTKAPADNAIAVTSDDPAAMYEAAEKAGIDPFAEGAGTSPESMETGSLLPEKYANAESSGLIANVTAGGKNDFTFALED